MSDRLLEQCHCGDCLKLHGNYFAMLAVPSEQVAWSGELAPQWYASSPEVQRSHCPRCGSRLAKLPAGGARTLLSAGLFPRDIPQRVRKNLWEQSAPDWATLPAVQG